MEIILRGQHTGVEALDSFEKVFQLFKDRYQIGEFEEIHLSVTLIDKQGDVVELVDSVSDQAYRIFEVHREGIEVKGRQGLHKLQLVVDNTK